jgi:hypothetical protein
VLVIAPVLKGQRDHERYVVRLPALDNFNDSDFSVEFPHFNGLTDILDEFDPQIVHSQHSSLLGMTALRIARSRDLPIVFTYHTLDEHDTHYVPGDSALLLYLTIELDTRYANLMHQVIAPSECLRERMLARGVTAPVIVIPTGACTEHFKESGRQPCRSLTGIPDRGFSLPDSTDRLLDCYQGLLSTDLHCGQDESRWQGVPRRLRAEWEILGTLAGAIGHSLEHVLNDPESGPDDRH